MSFIQVQKAGSTQGKTFQYVHLAQSVRRKGARHPVQERVYVGRLDEGTGDVVVGKGYPAHAGERIALVELRRRAAAGEDLATWLAMPIAPSSTQTAFDLPAAVEVVGDAHALLQVAGELKLEPLLAGAFGEADAAALLGLAMHQVAEGRPLYLAGDWLDERNVPASMRGNRVEDDAAYALMGRIGEAVDAREGFARAWIAARGTPAALAYDTTSISTYAAALELAEFGHNRDGEDLPQVNLALVGERGSGMPLWYRTLPGSIPDVTTLRDTLDFLRDFGIQELTAVTDRGFYSEANLGMMILEGVGFISGVPFFVKQAQELVRKHRATLLTPKHSFDWHGRILRHVRDSWTVDLSKARRKTGKTRPAREEVRVDAHLFFEPARYAERMVRMEKAVFELEEKASKRTFPFRRDARQWLAENARAFSLCLKIVEENGAFHIRRSPRGITQAAAHLGFTLVLQSRPGVSGQNTIADYFSRDTIEKMFDHMKNENGQHRLRTGGDASAEGRIFLAFLALILRGGLEAKLRTAGLLRALTVPDFLASLRKIKAVRTRSGKRILLEISKRNRTLLEAVTIPLPT